MDDQKQVKMISSLDFDISKVKLTMENLDSIFENAMREMEKKARSRVNNINNILGGFNSNSASLSKNKVILDQYGSILSQINTQQDKHNRKLQEETAQMKQQLNLAEKKAKVKNANSINDENVRESPFKARVETAIGYGIIYETLSAAKTALNTISDVEMGITQIARVTEDATFNFDKMRDSVIQLGIDYGQSFDNVQDITLRWAQAGYNVADTLELTKTSLLALNTAELDAQNSTESLIGIMAQWNLTAKDLPLVLDKINKVGDDFTVTSQDLVDGLLRSSGAAKIMGLSMEQTIAILTAMREATGRTGREVGNATNSILSYIQRASSIKVIESMGIRMFADEARTQFRNVFKVFQELSDKWNDPKITQGAKDALMAGAQEAGLFAEELANATGMTEEYAAMTEKASEAQGQFNDLQKRDAAQAAAGVYRRNYFIGLLEKFATTQEVLISMNEAEGYSMKENARTMETLEKKVQALKTSATQLAVAIGEAGLLDIMKDLADLGTDAIQMFNDLDPTTRNLIINLGTLIALSEGLKLSANLFGFGTEIKAVGLAVDGLLTSIGVSSGVATAGLLVAGAAILTIVNHLKKLDEEKQRLLDGTDSRAGEIENLNNLITKYEELEEKSKSDIKAKEELLELQRQLAQTYPEYVDSIGKEGEQLVTNLSLLKEQNRLKKEELDLKTKELMLKAPNKVESLEKQRKIIEDQLEANRKILSTPAEADGYIRLDGYVYSSKEMIRNNQELIDQLQKIIPELALYKSFIDKNTGANEEFEDAILASNKAVKDNTDTTNANSNAKHQNAISTEEQAKANEEFIKSFNEHTSNMEAYKGMLDEINTKEGLSAKSKNEIITKYQQFMPYLSNEKALREQLVKALGDEEEAQKQLFLSKIEAEATFYNSMLSNNKTLIDNLNKAYGVDLTNYKNLAQAKEAVDILWLQKATSRWATFYDLATDTLKAPGGTIGLEKVDSEYNRVSSAVAKLREFNKELDGIALKGVDFKAIKSTKGEGTKEVNKPLQEYLKNLAHKKAMDQLSIKDEIAGYEYALKKYKTSADEKMDLEERIHDAKKRLMAEEEKQQDKLNKKTEDRLKSQLDSLKDAYDKRIDKIEEAAEAEKKAQQDIIDGIEAQEKAMDRTEKAYDHERKLSDLNEKLRYHQMRTGVEHEEAIRDIEKQIAEENHDYQNELLSQGLEDQKEAAKDKIDNIEENAEKQKTILGKSLEDFEKLFDGTNGTIIANAMAMSAEYASIINNMIASANQAIASGGINEDFGLIGSGSKANTSNTIKSTVGTIVAYKKQYDDAMKANNQDAMQKAYENAKAYYSVLESTSKGRVHAEQLRQMNYEQAKKYFETATFHGGGRNAREGLALIDRNEVLLKPELASALRNFSITLARNPTQNISNNSSNVNNNTDNKKSVTIGTLFNAEKVIYEDNTDMESMARELSHVINSM